MNAKRPAKSFEQRLREQLLSRGVPIPETESRLLTISGQTTADVRPDFRRLALALQEEIERKMEGVELSSPLSGVIFFPTILNPNVASMPDFITHKRDLSVFVGLKIDHQTWINSSTDERITLLRDNLRASLEKIKKTYLSPEDKAVLLAAI
jgi:hypothetical protein